MKLKDINDINNIKLPGSRTVGSGYEFNVPMTNSQTVKNDNKLELDDENEIEDISDTQRLIDIATINSPFRKVPNIKKPPNIANLL